MYYYLIYGSITHASSVKKHFQNERGFVTTMHTPSCISPGGCTYSVRLREDKLQRALDISSKYNYRLRGVFKQHSDGSFSEVLT